MFQPILTRNKLPLQRIRKDMKEYIPKANYKLQPNVYKLSNDDKDKRFIAGILIVVYISIVGGQYLVKILIC